MSNTTALATINAAQENGALVFVNTENFEAKVDLYRTEVTKLQFKQEDFHALSDGFMPTKAAIDRIGEACGILFIQSACKVYTEIREDDICGRRTVYRAEAQGKVRMPDGSWRESTVDEYEFDPVLRAMLDKNVTELNDQTRKAIGRKTLELSKVARQRAATGARLRVIRQLTGMPTAFTAAEKIRPMVFTRIVQNTRYILQTPEGRAMATAQALGVDVASLFGGGKKALPQAEGAAPAITQSEGEYTDITAAPEAPPAEAWQVQSGTIPDFEPPPAQAAPAPSEFELLTNNILEFLEGFGAELNITVASGANPYKTAETELQNPNATVETRRDMINRLRAFLKQKGHSV
jgi:hypothetical protein